MSTQTLRVKKGRAPRQKPKKHIPKEHRKTRHHRRPRRLGGNGNPENISLIPAVEHQAWHTLFNHMHASAIAGVLASVFDEPLILLVEDQKVASIDFQCTGLSALYIDPSNTLDSFNDKQQKAWSLLWEGLSPNKILEDINARFLDPAYKIIFAE